MSKWRTLILAVCVPAVVVGCGYGCWRSFEPTTGFSADASLSPPLVASGPGPVHCVDPVHGPDGRHEITDGQVYSWRYLDQAVEAAYDRNLGHAFYYRSYR